MQEKNGLMKSGGKEFQNCLINTFDSHGNMGLRRLYL